MSGEPGYPASMLVEAWFYIAATLLIVSGGAKLRDPEPTRGALRVAIGRGLPGERWAVYVLAFVELLAGSAGLLAGGRMGGLLVTACYLGFAGFVAHALRHRLPLQSCGCFGRSDTPPGRAHLIVNLVSVAAASWVAATDGPGLLAALTDQPWAGIPYLTFVGLGTAALVLMLTDLPTLAGLAVRPPFAVPPGGVPFASRAMEGTE